ncbi:hypothetical protein INT45_006953 [Circinella minor]|uniref:Uncharacterized protein n=1 Tax=Circinella minor TaxID=1195481 RepID=A0A8H7S3X0_9FUNG|nr:hypothetical protein INT45_006953 [Circinella minor]
MSSNSKITILYSQAACAFFGVDLNPENELMCERKIDAMPDVELCYINDIPTEPFLVAKNRIKFFPFRYQLYGRSSSEEPNLPSISISNQHIHCESQLIDFVNSVFLITDPRNEAKLAAFTQFATKNDAHYLKAQITRKRMDSGRRIERKIVYIMKADDRAQNIGNYQGRFEMLIKGLKKDDFEVFGYTRKSPHNLSCESLKKNLQNMIDCLRHRSLVESVYVSPNSLAKSLISSRDMSNTDEKLTQMKLDHCAGSTQTLLKHLSSTEKKVCLVIVDYAALSTVPADVQAF